MSIVFAGTLTGLSTLKDKSLKLTLHTQEVDKNQASDLFTLNGCFVKVLISDSNIMPQQIEAVENFTIEEDGGKSPSQRLRAVLYRRWEQNNSKCGTFEEYYRIMMEKIITFYKGKLD